MSAITASLNTDFIDALDHHDAVDKLKILNRGAGFVITIERTKQDKTALRQTRKVFLRCWKSRPYKSSSTGARRSSTRSTECPWRACLTRQETGWRVEVKHMEHNHELESRATPERTILRRQKPQPPLRALAALTPHPVPGAPPPTQAQPQQYALPPFPYAAPAAPNNNQQYAAGGFSQFQVTPNQGGTMPAYSHYSTTPQGSPQVGAAPPGYPAQPGHPPPPPPQAAPALPTPAHAAAPSYAGRGRQRRGGYAVLSEIKVNMSSSAPSNTNVPSSVIRLPRSKEQLYRHGTSSGLKPHASLFTKKDSMPSWATTRIC